VNAIAFEVLRANPGARVVYLSSEEFTTELISSIRRERMEEFKQRFRAVDVLIVDDVQFLAGRDRTQEEFFHTFNVLHSAGRQIVLTSDVPPQEIQGLEERLRNRFEWGLIADIQPPDLETRAAIVERKAELDGISLDDDAAMLIAKHVASNVRELEGVLTRLGAQASLAGHRVTAAFVDQHLMNRPAASAPAIDMQRITAVVCDHFGVERSEILSRRRSRHIATPRQVAMYLCRVHLRTSYPRLGELFGRDHSTAIHAIETTEARLQRDVGFQEALERIERTLGLRH
jgi:chromosomal replication initiator protein